MDLSEGLAREERGELELAARFYQRALNDAADDRERANILIRLSTCLLDSVLPTPVRLGTPLVAYQGLDRS